jgi:hypothetical protein
VADSYRVGNRREGVSVYQLAVKGTWNTHAHTQIEREREKEKERERERERKRKREKEHVPL